MGSPKFLFRDLGDSFMQKIKNYVKLVKMKQWCYNSSISVIDRNLMKGGLLEYEVLKQDENFCYYVYNSEYYQ